jgi:hypothetical protein
MNHWSFSVTEIVVIIFCLYIRGIKKTDGSATDIGSKCAKI